jgi:hypothetical protein
VRQLRKEASLLRQKDKIHSLTLEVSKLKEKLIVLETTHKREVEELYADKKKTEANIKIKKLKRDLLPHFHRSPLHIRHSNPASHLIFSTHKPHFRTSDSVAITPAF